jgi:hypothetical protein
MTEIKSSNSHGCVSPRTNRLSISATLLQSYAIYCP